jgi:glyoxylase-like metal-dependent hydrolase (beta-lactamase superfamily II)/ACT domain-containing protein
MSERYFLIYRSESGEPACLGKGSLFLVDRPGSLAELATLFARHGANIIFFHYNRSEHPNRVLLEVRSATSDALERAHQELSRLDLVGSEFPAPQMELGVLDTRNILKIEVQLQDRPGTLGEFARLLSKHNANVIHMAYHEDISETSANFSLVTQDADEVDRLLKDINESGYYCSLIYRGAEQKQIEDIIGLNLVERFFFHLRRLLNTDDIERLRKIVDSSRRLSDLLVKFSREAGKHFEAGDITTKGFSYRRLPTLTLDRVKFHVFRPPTGGNINILESNEELVMVDGGYGLYYDDVKTMLKENGLDPAKIKRIYLSHADADHAGLSGYFAEDLGCSVYLHDGARGILEHENRGWGSDTPLLDLNHYFTVLVNEFTRFRAPENWKAYGKKERERLNGFSVIDAFNIGGQTYKVLESTGGHVPGQVFFISYDSGLVFTGDYLLRVDSLGDEERVMLNLPKFMMTSTNVNSALFRKEMDMLKDLITRFDADLRTRNRRAVIVPGHGAYYEWGGSPENP